LAVAWRLRAWRYGGSDTLIRRSSDAVKRSLWLGYWPTPSTSPARLPGRPFYSCFAEIGQQARRWRKRQLVSRSDTVILIGWRLQQFTLAIRCSSKGREKKGSR